MKETIVVTGAAGFVGQNLVRLLNNKGYERIILVDSLSKQNYFKNLLGLKYIDFINFEKGIDLLNNSITKHNDIDVIFHIGANADVLIEDCNIMLDMNFEHSKFWFDLSKENNIPFIYASSSAVYGNNKSFKVRVDDESPHNEYAFSKLVFDNYVRNSIFSSKSQVVGYRFFNIFGWGEFHKDKNASLPYRFFEFICDKGFIDLFDKDIERDYVSVTDVCNILYKTWIDKVDNGIYNLGSGNPISHDVLAQLVIDVMLDEKIIQGKKEEYIKKIPMPKGLLNKFQYLTHAEELPLWISKLTKNNKKKIKLYITQLAKRYNDDN